MHSLSHVTQVHQCHLWNQARTLAKIRSNIAPVSTRIALDGWLQIRCAARGRDCAFAACRSFLGTVPDSNVAYIARHVSVASSQAARNLNQPSMRPLTIFASRDDAIFLESQPGQWMVVHGFRLAAMLAHSPRAATSKNDSPKPLAASLCALAAQRDAQRLRCSAP